MKPAPRLGLKRAAGQSHVSKLSQFIVVCCSIRVRLFVELIVVAKSNVSNFDSFVDDFVRMIMLYPSVN